MPSLLVVDDDVDLCDIIEMSLELKYELEIVHDGNSAIEKLRERQFDGIILDWELPDMDGVGIAKRIRDEHKLTPILMLTGRKAIEDKVEGLDAGADDYLTKPFDMRELEARVRNLLRNRADDRRDDVLNIGNIKMTLSRHLVEISGVHVELTAQEFAVLELLMSNPGRSYSLRSLRQKLWNDEGTDDAVRACVKRLRHKMGAQAGEMLKTAFGIGYSIQAS